MGAISTALFVLSLSVGTIVGVVVGSFNNEPNTLFTILFITAMVSGMSVGNYFATVSIPELEEKFNKEK